MSIRVCPRCGSEFQPHVATCIDCGGPTAERAAADDIAAAARRLPPDLDADDDLDRDEEEMGSRLAIPAGTEVALLRQAELGWLQDVAAALDERGIPWVIQAHPVDRNQHALLVRAEDAEEARRIDWEVYRASVADAPEAPEAPTDAFEREGACPACGAELPAGAIECPECELVVGGVDPGPPEAGDEA